MSINNNDIIISEKESLNPNSKEFKDLNTKNEESENTKKMEKINNKGLLLPQVSKHNC